MKIPSKKWIIVCAALLVLALVCMGVQTSLAGRLLSQRAAERWGGEGDMEFRQLSAFLTEDGGKTENDIYTFRQTLLGKFTEASLETPENGSLFSDAWSGEGKVRINSDKTGTEAQVLGVGGDYFLFHPLTLLSGSYLTEHDASPDRVLLDKELAWKLFGGYDLAGMTVEVNGTPYVVAGVVERESDKASEKAYDGGAGLYMPFASLAALDENVKISCYEIVLPEPVEDFAEKLMQENFKIDGELRMNTGRFRAANALKLLREFGTRSIHSSALSYPYWENAARYYEDWCTLLTALAIALLIAPTVLALVMLVRCILWGRGRLRATVPGLVSDAREKAQDRAAARWGGKHLKQKGAGADGKRDAEEHTQGL